MKKSLIALATMAAMGCSVASSRRRFDEPRGHERRAHLDMGPSMILDALLQLSAAQAVTASAVSTNTVDLGAGVRDIGPGEPLFVVITVDVAATAAGAATVNFQVISSAAANLSSPTILGQTDALAKTELTLGRRPIVIHVPHTILAAQPIGQRYIGLQYAVSTGPLTAGSFTAYITRDPQVMNKLYPSGFAVG